MTEILQPKVKFKKSINILLIDDRAFFLDLISNILSSFKFRNIFKATHERMAMQYLLTRKFDVIFLDLELKNQSGFELYTKMKEVDPNLYVIIISDSPYEKSVERALKLGAKGFLRKPFTPIKIMTEMDKFFTEGDYIGQIDDSSL